MLRHLCLLSFCNSWNWTPQILRTELFLEPWIPELQKLGGDVTVMVNLDTGNWAGIKALAYCQTNLINYRIIECFGLEGTFRGHLAQPPCNKQGHLQLDQVVQSPIQPGLECFQGWGTYHLSGQPIPAFHHPHCKKFLANVQSKPILFCFKSIIPHPIATISFKFPLILKTFPIYCKS